MKSIQQLLEKNEAWAKKCRQEDPAYFTKLSELQKPDYLWIGCSDARVPANTILGLASGEVFVHRNVGNQVVHSDINCLSVIQYAVEFLQVKDIIVCGHYGCGGVLGALSEARFGLIDHWLWHIKNIYALHREELEAIPNEMELANRLCELNVLEQVKHVCSTNVVRDAWSAGQTLSVHGFIYDIHDGLIRDLGLNVTSLEDFERKIGK
ncbi:MAG: carbonate dehydratase [Deltaproteobacteria bacterium]|nr:carbonate dehydratase [Deltaproteobacteria bacterium]